MDYNDVMQRFDSLVVCKAVEMDEIRIKGKFLRIQDIEDSAIEIVMSKWYYTMSIERETNVIIGVHQDDERNIGNKQLRPYLDIGIAVLMKTRAGDLEIVDIRDFVRSRECEIELKLEPGEYIILPRTTGCTLRPLGNKEEIPHLIHKDVNSPL